MYPETSLFIAFGQVAIIISVLSSYALQVHPCRNCLDKVLQAGGHRGESGDDDGDKDDEESDMSPLRHALLTSGIIGASFTIAYLVDNLQMGKWVFVAGSIGVLILEAVLAFVGSTGSTTISFILPGLFYWKVRGRGTATMMGADPPRAAIRRCHSPPSQHCLSPRPPSLPQSLMSSPPPLPVSRSLPSLVSLLDPDVDPQIIEALRSKDRIYVLKLGELMEALINDRRPRIDLTPSTSYQRLLVHRCSAYYRLAPENDPASKGIFVVATPESRIPARRLSDLVPPESTAAPAFKIMRRSPPERRSNRTQSQAGDVVGDEGDLSDPDPSESGSQGGRSNATGRSNKSRMTIEEREAAYNEARTRIFMDFEDKEKEKDMSASSSSISLASGSGGGGSSVSGDPDDSVSSPATESEYSVPNSREKRDSRHLGRNGSASSSSRSLRYNSNQGSSRNSRASSPSSFTYATIYEPNQSTYYDHSQHPSAGYNPSQYMYPYPPPGMPPNAYYGGGYPYYPYSYPSPPPHNTSDPSTPSSGDPYSGAMYPHQYAWTPPPHHPMQSPPILHPPQMPPPGAPPPPIPSPPQYPYMHHHPYAYPMPYYPIAPGLPVESPPGHVNNQGTFDVPRSLDGSATGQHQGGNNGGRNMGGTASPGGVGNGKNSHRHVNGGGKGKNTQGMNQRGVWNYGPGVAQGGYVTPPTETIGPRLNNTRRTSNNSVASSATSRSSNCDDVASTASSSTTSSSSRRTYTSTTSSQHPLPARPDWAVGLKPQPTLHSTQSRHRDHSHSNSRTMSPISSPSRNLNGNGHHHHHHDANSSSSSNTEQQQQQQPASLQSPTEFPPLSSGTGVALEKRTPVVSGAWGNTASARNIRLMSPAQGPQQQHGVVNALVYHHPQPVATSNGLPSADGAGAEDTDCAFERPPPKSTAELFNPKLLKRPLTGREEKEKDDQKELERGKGVDGPSSAGADLVERVETMSMDHGAAVECQPKEALAV
ncbi:hypothetical protein C0995_008434 [Termitomyces sp. Mi166|nr:hypothetical protein C0995_008434 [Termitomyces sp. Mi166\